MKHVTQVIAVSFAFAVGIFFLKTQNPNEAAYLWYDYLSLYHHSVETTSNLLMNSIEGERIRANLRLLTKEPHIAGTEANDRVGDTVARLWQEAGLKDEEGRKIFSTSGVSPVLIPDEQGAKRHQWLAYSAEGTVSGEIVYANRGSPGDFEYLKSLGIDVKGKLVLMRYGEGFRGDKVYTAQLNGASGAILFSDPDDVARDGPESVYPKTYWMPTEGVQRGSIIHGSGDPLTPLYPSEKGFYRIRTTEEAKLEGTLPSIPVLPVSYTTAYHILSRLDGIAVPVDWQARTIMFTAWDGEEHFLLGSTEFVEEYVNLLQHRAVAYLNMDCLYGNTSLHVTTTPSLYSASINAAKRVPNPNRKDRELGKATLYDSWIATFPSEKWPRPDMLLPGGGSDHAPFLNYAGVPVVDFKFRNATTRDNYPLYHSLYESPFVNEHLLDTDGFSIHKAVGQFWTELARELADEPVIPLNTTELAVMLLEEYLPRLRKELGKLKIYEMEVRPAMEQMNVLVLESQKFLNVARDFESNEAANERIMQVETCFINPRGMPGSPQSRHVLFSVSPRNSYSSSVMAAVYDSISEFLKAETTEKRTAKGRGIVHQLIIVLNSINCVVNTFSEHI